MSTSAITALHGPFLDLRRNKFVITHCVAHQRLIAVMVSVVAIIRYIAIARRPTTFQVQHVGVAHLRVIRWNIAMSTHSSWIAAFLSASLVQRQLHRRLVVVILVVMHPAQCTMSRVPCFVMHCAASVLMLLYHIVFLDLLLIVIFVLASSIFTNRMNAECVEYRALLAVYIIVAVLIAAAAEFQVALFVAGSAILRRIADRVSR
mmetsp:Transcript_49329/g.82059  ORF Transcript_49329/g.82059 Transcript_49329/m.82059 type:complete len:205 (-) Transcript_49329:491-1105(-)